MGTPAMMEKISAFGETSPGNSPSTCRMVCGLMDNTITSAPRAASRLCEVNLTPSESKIGLRSAFGSAMVRSSFGVPLRNKLRAIASPITPPPMRAVLTFNDMARILHYFLR